MKFLTNILIVSILASIIVCETDCPHNWSKYSIINGKQWCLMPKNYNRGVGYPWKFGDALNLDGAKRRCQNDNPNLGCEQNGAVIYPKCKEGFSNFGCCICSPYCPRGWTMVYTTFASYCYEGL